VADPPLEVVIGQFRDSIRENGAGVVLCLEKAGDMQELHIQPIRTVMLQLG
jgi:hypothetical protein